MAVTTAFLNAAASGGVATVTHIGLVNGSGVELTGGTYARKAVTWAAASGGAIHPTADLTFDVPAGGVVAGWKGFTALTAGTDFGGSSLTSETYTGAGQYVLQAASTGYTVAAA